MDILINRDLKRHSNTSMGRNKMTGIYLFLILLFPICAVIGSTYKKTYTSAEDWDNTLYDWKVDVTTSPGNVKLLKTELITDEMGVTTGNMEEVIIGKTWVKKEFLLDDVAAESHSASLPTTMCLVVGL